MFNKRPDTTFIEDVGSLIQPHVNGRVVKHEVRPLTQFGENYGSEMVKVDITVDEDGREHVVHAVGKLIPPTDMQLEIFNTQVTYKNEIGFYADIAPTLAFFQKEQGLIPVLDYFPKLYGARISLNQNTTEVDNDAVILMENLKINGYENIERYIGFNLDTTKLVLSTFANFQATVVAIKQKRPDLFETRIKPYFYEWKNHPPPMQLDTIIAENPETSHLTQRFLKLSERSRLRIKKIREPWATITHNDAWVNNIMFKTVNDEVEGIKLIDFQIFDHGSFACDLIFLLLTSVQIPVLKYHFDKLIRHYYDQFITTLQQLKVNIRPFTYESFQQELKIEAPFQVFHTLYMLPVIFGPKGMPKMPGRVRVWNPNSITNSASLPNPSMEPDVSNGKPPNGPGGPKGSKGPIFKITPECKQKMWYVVEEAAKRNWL